MLQVALLFDAFLYEWYHRKVCVSEWCYTFKGRNRISFSCCLLENNIFVSDKVANICNKCSVLL